MQSRVFAKMTCEMFKIGTHFKREVVPVYTVLDLDVAGRGYIS